MAQITDISSILKIVSKVLSDARFQECVTIIVSELLQQVESDKDTVSVVAPQKSHSDAPQRNQAQTSANVSSTDLSKLSDAGLRVRYYTRKKTGAPIEQDLNAELARRFPTYNPETQQFSRPRKHNTTYSEMTDTSLRNKYKKLVKQNEQISPELSAELARRFPTYNPEIQQFRQKAKVDFTTVTDRRLRHEFSYYTSHNLAIPDELNDEMARRFPKYNPENRQFTETDYTKSPDNSLRNLYYQRKNHGRPINPKLNAELARRFPTYNPATHTFEGVVTAKINKAPTIAEVPTESEHIPDSDLIKEYDRLKQAFRPIGVMLNARLAERFPGEDDPINQIFTKRPQINALKPVQSTQPVDLHVTLKQRNLTLQDAYYDVMVNGKSILSNHVNTELRTFLDGTILAVHGIVTDNSEYPTKPIWMLFDTNLQPNRFVSRDKFSGYRTYIQALQETPNDLRAICSNRSTVFLEMNKYKRIAKGARFVIDEKIK